MSAESELDPPVATGLDDDFGDIELVNEKPLTWFDVSAIGTGEMLFTAGWAWIVFIASSYGIMWTLIGFFGGVVVIHTAWWLYREMITAVPEPGSLQSYAREAGCSPSAPRTSSCTRPVYGGFMWLELAGGPGSAGDPRSRRSRMGCGPTSCCCPSSA